MKYLLLTESLMKTIFLNEKRHIPHEIKPIQEDVYTYIMNIFNTIYKSDKNENTVVYKNKNKFFDELTINFYRITDDDYYASYTGGYLNNNDKLENVSINIFYNKSVNLHILSASLLIPIYHEVEHLYDDWVRQVNGGYAYLDDNSTDYNNIMWGISKKYLPDNKLIDTICKVSYLSLKIEEKAFLDSVYNELKILSANSYNYREKIEDCESYVKYKKIKNVFIPIIKSSNNIDIILLNSVLNNLKRNGNKHNIPCIVGNESDGQYKERLIKWCEYVFNRFMKRVGGVIIQYLQDVQKNTTISPKLI